MTKSVLQSLFHDSSQLCSAPLKPPTPVFWGHRKNRNNYVWALGLSTHQQRWSACCCQRGTLSRKEVKADPGVTFLCRNIVSAPQYCWCSQQFCGMNRKEGGAAGTRWEVQVSAQLPHLQNGHNNTNLMFWARAQLLRLCPMLYNPMNGSPPGSSVHGILQARILEWVAISFCKGSSWPGTEPGLLHWQVDCLLMGQ